jgi:ABC-2 type transport system permease protein
MKKIILIMQREYMSRVKKKSFLVVTFLVPLLFIGMFGLIGYIAASQNELSEVKKVEVVDESGWFANKLVNKDNIEYTFTKENIATVKTGFLKSGYDYLLYIPTTIDNAQLIAEKKPAAIVTQTIESALSTTAQSTRLSAAHIDSAVVANAQKPVKVEGLQVTEAGIKKAHTDAAAGIGLVCAFLIYLTIFLYGSQVMRGVIEEKVSRIVEVIISAVKPFQLMMGKIIGVGLVGLTQFVLWIVLTLALSTVAGGMMAEGIKAKTEQVSQAQQHAGPGIKAQMQSGAMGSVMEEISSIPVGFTIACFLFYFLFGYLLYSALFAAVGSAVDSETETQQFMVPVTLPLVFTFIMAQSVILNNPDSPLAVWLSLIPFTSPIAMMMRIPFGGVPAWQLATSMVLMVLGFLFTTWVAGRIYRVGILMYGKKASYKELVKWFTYKD